MFKKTPTNDKQKKKKFYQCLTASPVVSTPCLKAQKAPAATDLLLLLCCHRQWDMLR